jgi:FKBP-type peptidyl-prolyl cis-trans isomerase
VRPTLALLALLALAVPRIAMAEDPKIPADGAPEVTTESGLKYSVLKAGGTGKKPVDGDPVTVKYTGWLKDTQKVFDASSRHGGTLTFSVGSLIKGWNEVLRLMTPGARWKVTIPPALGYGAEDVGGIPPNSTLVFDLELVALQPRFEFHPADPAKTTTTASGLKVQVITEGTGPKATEKDIVELAYALWTPAGRLVESSSPVPGLPGGGRTLRAPVGDMALPVLKEACLLLQVGTRLRVEAPAALAFKDRPYKEIAANGISVWEFELLGLQQPLPVPPFEKSAPGKAVKTASGLEIETLAEGTGASPKHGDWVTVHYAGWLVDGALFDASFKRGEPQRFQVGNVIEGWNEALKGMKEGGKVRLTIPSTLAYGVKGNPGSIPPIPPNATLIFYVELIKVGD